MPIKTKELTPPTGLGRILFRLPIWLYRLGLGGLLGKRFVLVNHMGRKSGKERQAVLEVVDYDNESQRVVVTAAFGEKTAWYQNLMSQPDTTIQIGWQKLQVTSKQLQAQESGEILLDFAKKNPGEARFVNLLGYEVDGSDEDWRAVGEDLIMVGFTPL
ncbi:MAG: nitroreductase family deazaflavin-dependent oxidoreductase [Chloroflexi bacterium]|nr:nitroreductase family deazaflavin-dependent oxidoreductase [Chloroflexota bacterium]